MDIVSALVHESRRANGKNLLTRRNAVALVRAFNSQPTGADTMPASIPKTTQRTIIYGAPADRNLASRFSSLLLCLLASSDRTRCQIAWDGVEPLPDDVVVLTSAEDFIAPSGARLLSYTAALQMLRSTEEEVLMRQSLIDAGLLLRAPSDASITGLLSDPNPNHAA